MDCTEHPRTCGKFDVEGYPTIKIFDSSVVGPPEEYEGERTLDGLLEYVLIGVHRFPVFLAFFFNRVDSVVWRSGSSKQVAEFNRSVYGVRGAFRTIPMTASANLRVYHGRTSVSLRASAARGCGKAQNYIAGRMGSR